MTITRLRELAAIMRKDATLRNEPVYAEVSAALAMAADLAFVEDEALETAPKDGCRVLCASASVFIGRHVDDSALWLDDSGAFRDPSRWMPLPLPESSYKG